MQHPALPTSINIATFEDLDEDKLPRSGSLAWLAFFNDGKLAKAFAYRNNGVEYLKSLVNTLRWTGTTLKAYRVTGTPFVDPCSRIWVVKVEEVFDFKPEDIRYMEKPVADVPDEEKTCQECQEFFPCCTCDDGPTE